MTDSTVRQRQSNMELLRIVAMFLVLVVHADFFSLGSPTVSETRTLMLSSGTRYFFESLSIVCVNVFVLISGWFGIRANLKGLCSFLFQCLFFLIGIYALLLLTGRASLSVQGLLGCFFMTQWDWFIKAYLGLYILSPVLNTFVEHADKRRLEILLLSFYLFQTLYSWCTEAAIFFGSGYSALSFMGLYLLARYARLHMPDLCGGGEIYLPLHLSGNNFIYYDYRIRRDLFGIWYNYWSHDRLYESAGDTRGAQPRAVFL